ncbi:hypothetical protein NEDG_01905 [Nematocida displodere]|uniref:Uncharacterized protein n=1 Tax=Nematocida displodere TaxID=1805483 RepID=A0A177EI32_9MICR|nr:hypothetical protein NEDG_01905 [Nematocida displodere]
MAESTGDSASKSGSSNGAVGNFKSLSRTKKVLAIIGAVVLIALVVVGSYYLIRSMSKSGGLVQVATPLKASSASQKSSPKVSSKAAGDSLKKGSRRLKSKSVDAHNDTSAKSALAGSTSFLLGIKDIKLANIDAALTEKAEVPV